MGVKYKISVSFKLNRGRYIIGRIRFKGARVEFQTGLTISDESIWENGQPNGKTKEANQLRNSLKDLVSEIEGIEINHHSTAASIKHTFLYGSPHDSSIPCTVKQALAFNHQLKIKDDRPYNTVNNALKIQNSFSSFLNENNIDDINLNNLDRLIIQRFDSWLKSKGLNDYSRYQYFAGVSSAIESVIREHLDKPEAIKINPIAKTIKRPKARLLNKRSQQRHLDDEQVTKIENLCLLGKTNRVDNEWWKLTILFQAYSGFSFVDLGDNFEVLKGEIDIIEIDRKKTSIPSIIPVIPELRNVLDGLEHYRNKYRSERIFPIRQFVLGYQAYDKKLYDTDYQLYRNVIAVLKKEIGYAGEQLSSHYLRHTFGMRMLNEYAYSAEEVAIMMGDDIKTVLSTYARVGRNRIIEATKNKFSPKV